MKLDKVIELFLNQNVYESVKIVHLVSGKQILCKLIEMTKNNVAIFVSYKLLDKVNTGLAKKLTTTFYTINFDLVPKNLARKMKAINNDDFYLKRPPYRYGRKEFYVYSRVGPGFFVFRNPYHEERLIGVRAYSENEGVYIPEERVVLAEL